MKNLFLSTLLLLVGITSFAQSEKYTAAMKKNLVSMDSGFSNPANILIAANNFALGLVLVSADNNFQKSSWL